MSKLEELKRERDEIDNAIKQLELEEKKKSRKVIQAIWNVPACDGCFEDIKEGTCEGRYVTVRTMIFNETMNFDDAQGWAKKQGGRCLTVREIHLLVEIGRAHV